MRRAPLALLAALVTLTTAGAAHAGVQIDVIFPDRTAFSVAADGAPAAGSGAVIFGSAPAARQVVRVATGAIGDNYIELYGVTTVPARSTLVTWRLVIVRGVAQWTINPGTRGASTWIGPASVQQLP